MPIDTDALLLRYTPIVVADSRDKFLAGVALHGCMTNGWAQYWLAWPGDRDHVGTDWEMVMWRLAGDTMDLAVFAQHRIAQLVRWTDLQRDGDHARVYASRDKHASRPTPGWHRHGWRWDKCNAKIRLDLELRIGAPPEVKHRLAHRDPAAWFAHLNLPPPRKG